MPGRVTGIVGREVSLPFSLHFYSLTLEIQVLLGSAQEKRTGEGSLNGKGTFLVWTFLEDALEEVDKSEDVWVLFEKSYLC